MSRVPEPLLEVRNLSQEFPAVRALNNVSLTFEAGTVHGIVGENGAGKSTLMRILAGLLVPTSGELLLDGEILNLKGVREAEAQGITMIHQELNLVEELSVADNIFLGRELKKGIALDRDTMAAIAATYLGKWGAHFSPQDKVKHLSLAQKQLVEIAKALSHEARVVIMDEPTAVLSAAEVESLFEVIQTLRDSAVTVIYISHLLPEVIRICDVITVMRDGEVVETLPASEATAAGLANRMVGRDLGDFFPPQFPVPAGKPKLEIKNLQLRNTVNDVSITIRPGEIVGLAGLIGSGRTETAEAIVGLRPRIGGNLELDGMEISPRSPVEAKRLGIAYVSEDRKGAGLVLAMDTSENLSLASMRSRNAAKEKMLTEDWVSRLDIRGDITAPVRLLSGGNQQKVSVAKWLATEPQVLILDEPTRGVDVGAKREIYDLIVDLAARGLACLVISSEMNELIGLCQRVYVLRQGRVAGELVKDQLTEEAIMRLAAGVTTETA